MKIILPLLLFLLAAATYGAVKLGVVSNRTLQALANVGAIVAAVTAIVVIPWSIPFDNTKNQRNDELSQTHIGEASGALIITSPKNESEVGQFVSVEGHTNFTDLLHYIVVGPQTGSVWVTDGPLLIRESGNWTGRAQLGTGTIGEGEFFLIHVVATNRELQIGEESMDAVKNAASAIMTVKVLRRKEEKMK